MTTPSHDSFLRTRTFLSLDGLRAVAVLMVIQFHGLAGGVSFPVAAWRRGFLGVHLFFVISGFLITTLLLRERAASGDISLRRFYMRRTLRIFPLYYAVLLAYCVLVALVERDRDAANGFWRNLPYFATYTSNVFVSLFPDGQHFSRVIFYFSWSLATEEQFYLVWPFLLKRLPWPIALSVLIATIGVNQIAIMHLVPLAWMQPLLENLSTGICLGVVLAIALNSRRGFEALRTVLGRWWSVPAALGLVAAGLCLPEGVRGYEFLMDAAFAVLVGACVIRSDHALAPALQNRVMRGIGSISYGLYLLHMLCLGAAGLLLSKLGMGGNLLAKFVLGVTLAFAAAALSYRYFEGVFLRLKQRYSSSHAAPPAPAAAKLSVVDPGTGEHGGALVRAGDAGA